MSTSNTSAFHLRSLLEKEKFNGANFMDWYRNLRIVLRQEKTEYVPEPYPEDLLAGSSAAECRAHEKRCEDTLNVNCLILSTMSPDLQK
jgi:hypothetical protein